MINITPNADKLLSVDRNHVKMYLNRHLKEDSPHCALSRCDKIKQMNFRTHTMGSVTEEQFISIRDYVTLFFHSAMYIMSDAIPYPTTYVRRYNG